MSELTYIQFRRMLKKQGAQFDRFTFQQVIVVIPLGGNLQYRFDRNTWILRDVKTLPPGGFAEIAHEAAFHKTIEEANARLEKDLLACITQARERSRVGVLFFVWSLGFVCVGVLFFVARLCVSEGFIFCG